MPYPVPPSRLLPPRLAKEVARPRLLGLLEEAFRQSPGVALVAGAGYGKTSLATDWPGGVYLALAEEARDPVVLLWHLLAAYSPRLNPAPAAEALEVGAWPLALEALLGGLAGLPPHLLVLDDWHQAEGRETLRVLQALLRLPNLRLLLLSRKTGGLALLRIVGERELAFDPGEARALAQVLAPGVPAFEAERALSLVQGWPLGLRILLLAMRRGLKPEEALDRPEGLLAYLAYGLPPEVLEGAARLALLGEAGEEEASFLLPYAQDLLLERQGGRVRFHPLVRAALRPLVPGPEARALLDQAAQRALERGEGVRAAEHLLEAGRYGHAADLLLKEGAAWLERGLAYTVLRLLDRLPPWAQRNRSGLALLRAEALRQAGRYEEAEAAYRQALEGGEGRAYLGLGRLFLDTVEPARARIYLEEALRRYPEEAQALWAENLLNEGRAAEAWGLGLRGPRVLLRLGRPQAALELLKDQKDPGLNRPPQNHREGSLLRALLECLAGDAEEGLRWAERGRYEAEALGSPFGMALAEARRGHALLTLGRLGEAQEAYRLALGLAEGGPARLKVEALGGLAALGGEEAYPEMLRLARASGDLWVEGFMTLVVALARLRQGEAWPLPPLGGLDPFLEALARAYPFREEEALVALLKAYPFLAQRTLLAPPLPRVRRALWRMGRLPLPYHPGVRVEIRALGGFQVLVDGRPVRFRREKARLLLALLVEKDWDKEELIEALGVSPGEFRVLWWEVLNALEPGRPKRAPGYFLRSQPWGLNREAPELHLDLLDPQAPLAQPYRGLDHPFLEERAQGLLEERRRALLQSPRPQDWWEAFRLDPLDEEAFRRLLATPLAQEAQRLRAEALAELGLSEA